MSWKLLWSQLLLELKQKNHLQVGSPFANFAVRGVMVRCLRVGSIPQDSGLMPPHNPAAELPQDVYDVSDSILSLWLQ